MLTAIIDLASKGSGVDENDNSNVRYTIIAHVFGNNTDEVKAFHDAWIAKFKSAMERCRGSKATPCDFSVEIVSPGWPHIGIGREKVAQALREFGVQVLDEKEAKT